MTPSVAAMATVATMLPAMAAAAGRRAGATAITSRNTTATMTAVAGHGHLLTAHQGDANDREENRDGKN
jgi:hypothetical protein